jgi:hypothetical protein
VTATQDHLNARTSNAASWLAIAVLCMLVILFELAPGRPIAVTGLGSLALASAALGGVAWWYRTVRPLPHFADMCIALMQVLLFSSIGVLLSYLVARHGGAMWDNRLSAWDGTLGLDWLGYVRLIDSSAALTRIYNVAYSSLIPQIIILVLALGFSNRIAQLRSVMCAAILCGITCILLSPFFPAVSNFVHHGLSAADFRNVNPWAGDVHMADLNALRGGSFALLDLGRAEGIITFPSYHGGLSAVTLWGFWLTRQWWIRWPGMVLASLTILATPVDGGHYFVDVLAGIAIAVASIVAARRAVRWKPAMPALTALPFRRSHEASAR